MADRPVVAVLPLARTVAAQFDRGIELGHGDEDMAAAYHASAPDA